jgi:hypothetical protein
MSDDARRVVLVLIDGARADVLRDLLDRGELPHLARHVVEPGGMVVGTSTFPSTTGVAYLPFLMGRYPGPAGIPGIRWLDRAGAAGGWVAQWRAARSYCGIQVGWLDHDIQATPSIFELVPDSVAICSPVTRGLAPQAHLIPRRRALLGSLAHYANTYLWLDRAVASAWVAAAQKPWRFLFVVFPGPDGLTHNTDPFDPSVLQSYREIDAALGRFAARVTGELVFFVAADHGATAMPVHSDIAVQLEAWGVRTLRHPLHVWRRHARAAVMVSGNASAQVWFGPRTGRAEPLTAHEMPLDLVERLVSLEAVRLAACRSDDDGVLVMTATGRAALRDDGGAITYEPIRGDPLGLGSEPLGLDDREMLARSRATDVPDAPRQLLQLLRTDRAGDLVLAARAGCDFRGPWEIPEHRAGHGSLIADHMEVPILSSVPLPRAPLRTADLMPAILELLGVEAPAGLDGMPFSALAALEAVPAQA